MKKIFIILFALSLGFSIFAFSGFLFETSFPTQSQKETHYLSFNDDIIQIKIGEEVDVFSCAHQTNLCEFNNISVTTSDENVVSVENHTILGVNSGKADLTFFGKYRDKIAILRVNVFEEESSSNEDPSNPTETEDPSTNPNPENPNTGDQNEYEEDDQNNAGNGNETNNGNQEDNNSNNNNDSNSSNQNSGNDEQGEGANTPTNPDPNPNSQNENNFSEKMEVELIKVEKTAYFTTYNIRVTKEEMNYTDFSCQIKEGDIITNVCEIEEFLTEDFSIYIISSQVSIYVSDPTKVFSLLLTDTNNLSHVIELSFPKTPD